MTPTEEAGRRILGDKVWETSVAAGSTAPPPTPQLVEFLAATLRRPSRTDRQRAA